MKIKIFLLFFLVLLFSNSSIAYKELKDKIYSDPKISLRKKTATTRICYVKKGTSVIPLKFISPFLNQDIVVDYSSLKNKAKIIGDISRSVLFYSGDVFYTKGNFQPEKLYDIYRIATKFVSPVTGEYLGHYLIFIGKSKVDQDIALLSEKKIKGMNLIVSKKEAREGDLILEPSKANDFDPCFFKHFVSKDIKGHILGTLDHINFYANWDRVIIDKGSRENIVIGSVFKIFEGKVDIFQRSNSWFKEDITAPNIPIGELMVVKVYEKTSLALIIHSNNFIHKNSLIEGLEF